MTQGITYILNNNATFQSLSGLNAAGVKYKAYPMVCPQPEQAPYSVVVITNKIPYGQCKESTVTYQYSFDVVSYHKNFEQMVTLDDAVVAALDNQSGTFNSIVFDSIRWDSSRDGDYSQEYHVYSRISSFVAIV